MFFILLFIIEEDIKTQEEPETPLIHAEKVFNSIKPTLISTIKNFQNNDYSFLENNFNIKNIEKRQLEIENKQDSILNFNITISLNSNNGIKYCKYESGHILYEYYFYRNKYEFTIKSNNYIIRKDRENNLHINYNNNEYQIKYYGKVVLSEELINKLYHENNNTLKTQIFDIIKTDHPETEYAMLSDIYLDSNDMEDFIIKSINNYREIISEKALERNHLIQSYSNKRLNYYITNELIPQDHTLESPLFEGFSGIDLYERKSKLGINDEIYEIALFIDDPLNLISYLFQDLDHRAKLLSLNAKSIGVSYNQETSLMILVIAYDSLVKKIITRFRVFPPHNSRIIPAGIEYESGTVRGYPVSIHCDGIYDNNYSLFDMDNNNVDFTGGVFYGDNTKYIIAKKPFEKGREYFAKFPFTNIDKPIKSYTVRFYTYNNNYYSDFDIENVVIN